ncbi:MAG: class I SAM-dependent methyltransferase [Terriglobia bacterium]
MIEARGQRRAIQRAYNIFSFLYARSAALLERESVKKGLERAQVRPGERVLEVAVGTAAAFGHLRRRVGGGGLLIGVDLSPGMLRVTRRRVPGARLVQADARALPFPADSFDLLWASYLLDLIPTEELTPLLAEFHRVLKPAGAGRPGGRLLLLNFSKGDNRLTWWERAYRLTPTRLVPYLFGSCRPLEAEPFVRAAGFVEVERTFIPGGLDSEIITARK